MFYKSISASSSVLVLLYYSLMVNSNVKDSLGLYYYNATSIRGKLFDFNNFFTHQDYPVICVSESWLFDKGVKTVYDGEVLDNIKYAIYRNDRDLDRISRDDGGGVLCAINNELTSSRRDDLEVLDLELVWVELTLTNKRIFVGTLYLPCKCKVVTLAKLEESIGRVIKTMHDRDNLVLVGDFNRPDIKWCCDENDHVVASNADELSTVSSQFMEILYSHNLTQFNKHATCGDATLDLVITDGIDAQCHITDNATTSTHRAIDVSLAIPHVCPPAPTPRVVYSYRKADFNNIIQALSCIWWCTYRGFSTVDQAFNNFYDVMYAVIDDNVPRVNIRVQKYPTWYTSDLISLIKEKYKWRKKYIKSGSDTMSNAYKQFSCLRADVKRVQKYLYTEYISSVCADMKVNAKRFWSFSKSKRSSSSIPKAVTYNSITYSTTQLIATAFNNYFQSVFISNKLIETFNDIPFLNVPTFRMSPLTYDEVRTKLKNLNLNGASGHDNMSAVFLSKSADVIYVPLTDLFNRSLSEGVYPSVLKLNNVIPIFKKGKKNDVLNYRGISIQPIIGKIFEFFVNKALRFHLKLLICEEQHGFMACRSTSTNLAVYTEIISKCFDDKTQLNSIYTDFSRAFDVVPHNLLLLKMERQFGISNNLLKWFDSYLTDRFQRVVLKGCDTDWVKVTSGVPQGSILGPTLFLMYINDLPDSLRHAKCLLFADDAKIFKEIKCVNDCRLLQFDIDSMLRWCSNWRITLNVKKCFFINFSLLKSRNIDFVYHINESIVERVTLIKDLGVTFTYNLNFSVHISNVTKKSLQMFGFMKRVLKPINDPHVFLTLYHTLIRSRLEYCSFVWSPKEQTMRDKLERVQRKFVKFISFKCNISSDLLYQQKCQYFNLQTLESRREMLDLRMLNKILCNKVDCPELLNRIGFRVPTRRTRCKDLFVSNHRLRVSQNSPISRSTNLANDVCLDVFSPVSEFRRNSTSHFQS